MGDPSVDLDACAQEPVHIIGQVQSHGLLLALSEPDLVVRQVSTNIADLLGIAVDDVLERPFEMLLDASQHAAWRQYLLLADPSAAHPLRVTVGSAARLMECTAHRYDGVLIVELALLEGAYSLGPLDLEAHIRNPLARLARAADITELSRCAANEIRRLSSFDRVMIYRFDEEWNGEVLAEAVGPSPVAYLGLRFPPGDIPSQVRRLFLSNTLRSIADVDAPAAPIVPTLGPLTGRPLDLTHSSLRSPATVHLEYLRNMGVQSSMTISIIVNQQLWGMIACHDPAPHRLDYATRAVCELIGQQFASQAAWRISNLALNSRLTSRDRLESYMAAVESTRGARLVDLAELLDADGLIWRTAGVLSMHGVTVNEQILQPMLEVLRGRSARGVASSNALSALDSGATAYASQASGALYLSLTEGTGDYLVLLRRELVETVVWAGNPDKAVSTDGLGRLRPRASFASWQETVRGRSRPWTPLQLENAALLREQLLQLRANADRIRAEAALRASEERFRNQYKGFPLPTYSWLQVGDDFVMQDFNDAARAIAEDDSNGWVRGIRASEGYADQPEIMADLRACLVEQRPVHRELHFRYPVSGRERDLAFSYVFVPPQTVMLHTEDITEARQAEQQREAMAQSEKLRALGQMATGIAHDLNQSLMLVASYSELARQALLQQPTNFDELDNLLATATQAALDGGESVKRLLVFTRAPSELEGKRVDLSGLMRDAAQLTAPRWRDEAQAEGRPISMHIEAVGHPIIQGSPARLRELMTNLIFNAVDALPNGGTIRLRVRGESGEGVIEIADSGVGMSPAIREHIFEPFFTTKGESGSGMGLAMVFGIVKQHGGHIEVHSVSGNGTTFHVAFPLLESPSEMTPTPSTPGLSEPGPGLRILAVDDEPMMTKAVGRMLKPSGHKVTVAATGEEALRILTEQTFDVVVSDMGMGAGMNGLQLADAVKLRWPNVRFLLATGWGAAIDPREARARGVEAVLSKPYRPADLLAVLAADRAA